MATPTQYYVDPNAGVDSAGNGTIGSPYLSVQYCLNDINTTHGGRDATDGDQINIKAGTDDVLGAALSLATYGTPTIAAPLIFRGYTTAKNDGGQGGIDGAGLYAVMTGADIDYVHWFDLHLHNCSGSILLLDNGIAIENCEFDECNNFGVSVDNYSSIVGCRFTNITGSPLDVNNANVVTGNYFKNDAATKPGRCIYMNSAANIVERNIMSVDGATHGIETSNVGNFIRHNTIYGGGSGTGSGISFDATSLSEHEVSNNIISGFSGVGGDGVDFGNLTAPLLYYGGNAFYNNTTDEANVGGAKDLSNPRVPDNEALGSDPFAKSGSDTFANRFAYFAPNDVGNLHGGALPAGHLVDKGAIQHVDPAGGGGGGTKLVGFGGGMVG